MMMQQVSTRALRTTASGQWASRSPPLLCYRLDFIFSKFIFSLENQTKVKDVKEIVYPKERKFCRHLLQTNINFIVTLYTKDIWKNELWVTIDYYSRMKTTMVVNGAREI